VHLRAEALDACPAGVVELELGLDRVRRVLVDALEPLDEHVHLGTPRRVDRKQRRLGVAALEVAHDRDGVIDHLAGVLDHRHQALAADVLDGPPVGVLDQDRLRVDALESQGQAHALAVRRPLGTVKAHRRSAGHRRAS
jgi:hypothetical protein